jgi:hypothetical protein
MACKSKIYKPFLIYHDSQEQRISAFTRAEHSFTQIQKKSKASHQTLFSNPPDRLQANVSQPNHQFQLLMAIKTRA